MAGKFLEVVFTEHCRPDYYNTGHLGSDPCYMVPTSGECLWRSPMGQTPVWVKQPPNKWKAPWWAANQITTLANASPALISELRTQDCMLVSYYQGNGPSKHKDISFCNTSNYSPRIWPMCWQIPAKHNRILVPHFENWWWKNKLLFKNETYSKTHEA